MDPPVVFASRPGALRVRLPRHALQVSPAARTARVLSASALAELGRVAAGLARMSAKDRDRASA
jgi:hypothetical protein